jgi:hypothetical protein
MIDDAQAIKSALVGCACHQRIDPASIAPHRQLDSQRHRLPCITLFGERKRKEMK